MQQEKWFHKKGLHITQSINRVVCCKNLSFDTTNSFYFLVSFYFLGLLWVIVASRTELLETDPYRNRKQIQGAQINTSIFMSTKDVTSVKHAAIFVSNSTVIPIVFVPNSSS